VWHSSKGRCGGIGEPFHCFQKHHRRDPLCDLPLCLLVQVQRLTRLQSFLEATHRDMVPGCSLLQLGSDGAFTGHIFDFPAFSCLEIRCFWDPIVVYRISESGMRRRLRHLPSSRRYCPALLPSCVSEKLCFARASPCCFLCAALQARRVRDAEVALATAQREAVNCFGKKFAHIVGAALQCIVFHFANFASCAGRTSDSA
jgi:hypothetical protein